MRQAARVYFETQVTTTSQGQILLMLYDGAVNFLNQAKELIAVKDYVEKGKRISSAIDIINELASSLNAEKGGDLAANLNQLYFYCNKRLFMANSRMDTTIIDEVIKILSGIRSAYAQIMETPEAIEAMAQAAAASSAAKGPRTPVGAQACPASSTPIPKAKAHNAYATQSAAVPGAAENAVQEKEPEPSPAVPEAARPEPQDIPDLSLDAPATPPPSLTSGKRLAAGNVYRKFVS